MLDVIRYRRTAFNPIQDEHFQGYLRIEGVVKKTPPPRLPKVCHTYSAIMKLDSYTLPKEDPKNI